MPLGLLQYRCLGWASLLRSAMPINWVVDLKNSIDIPEIAPNTVHETMGQPPSLSELKCHETANLTTAFEWRAMAWRYSLEN